MQNDELQIVTDINATDDVFKSLFRQYFDGFGFSFPDKGFIHMSKDVIQYDIKISILYLKDEPIGFAMYQIDRLDNPWFMYENVGDVREFFIVPKHRKKGYARFLFQSVKAYFLSKNVKDIYLTSDDTGEFWEKLGFHKTGIINKNNNSEEFHMHVNEFT